MALKHHTMLAIVALAAFSSAPVWADDDVLEIQQQGDISYVSGGIGQDESDALQATQRNYNLHVMNADKSGHFSGDTRIVISDSQHNPLLDATSGPLFYANLPKGKYIVEGFAGNQSKKQVVTIAKGNPVRVHFTWLQDATD